MPRGPPRLPGDWDGAGEAGRFNNGENPAGSHQLSPLTHARCVSLPPALFVYGRGDPVVHARQGRLAEAAWKRAGAHAETLILPNIGHGVVGDNRAQRRRFLEKALEFGAWRHAGG